MREDYRTTVGQSNAPVAAAYPAVSAGSCRAATVTALKPTFDVDMLVTEADRLRCLEIEATDNASRNAFTAVASMDLEESADGGRP